MKNHEVQEACAKADYFRCQEIAESTATATTIAALEAELEDAKKAVDFQVDECRKLEEDRNTWKERAEFSYRQRDALEAEVERLEAENNALIESLIKRVTTIAQQSEKLAAAEKDACALWMMLDDIDTGGDIAKADDVLYRAIAERSHKRRFGPRFEWVIKAIGAAIAEGK